MLRRKLLLVLALLTLLMLGTALSSIVLMQGVLQDMERINSVAIVGTTATSRLNENIATIEDELVEWQRTSKIDMANLENLIDPLGEQINELQRFYIIAPDTPDPFPQLQRSLIDLEQSISLAVKPTPENITLHLDNALIAAREMHEDILNHADFAFEYMKIKQNEVTARFRRTAIGLAISFVILINVSIIVLLRAAAFVLKPIDRLLEASRHLAHEDYDFRVDVGRKDEFEELAHGFNSLAEQLHKNEERKVETLHQVARTLNHELNNAIAIIELQLRMVAKSSGYDNEGGNRLRLIHEALHHMNETVVALTHVRRVVLTDYIEGVKMLDIKLSTLPDDPAGIDKNQSGKVYTQ